MAAVAPPLQFVWSYTLPPPPAPQHWTVSSATTTTTAIPFAPQCYWDMPYPTVVAAAAPPPPPPVPPPPPPPLPEPTFHVMRRDGNVERPVTLDDPLCPFMLKVNADKLTRELRDRCDKLCDALGNRVNEAEVFKECFDKSNAITAALMVKHEEKTAYIQQLEAKNVLLKAENALLLATPAMVLDDDDRRGLHATIKELSDENEILRGIIRNLQRLPVSRATSPIVAKPTGVTV